MRTQRLSISRSNRDDRLRLVVRFPLFLSAIVAAAAHGIDRVLENDKFYDLVVNEFERFVDKTGMIEEFLEEPFDVIRIVRPDGWGKTTNLHMLKRFFEVEEDGNGNSLPPHRQVNRKLFYGGEFGRGRHAKTLRPLNISRSDRPEKKAVVSLHQGQYPVISLDFDRLIGTSYEDIKRKMRAVLANLFRRYRYLVEKRAFSMLDLFLGRNELRLGRGDGKVEERDRLHFEWFESGFAESDFDLARPEYGLKLLSKLLFNRYGRSVFVLIDNYDAPLNELLLRLVERYRKADYADADAFSLAVTSREFRRAVSFFQRVYKACFKTNPWLHKGVLTGTADVYFPKLTDGFNNTYSLLDGRYSTWYGLSDAEVDGLIRSVAVNVTTEDRLALRVWCSYDAFGAVRRYRTATVQRYIEYGTKEVAEKTANESRETGFSVAGGNASGSDLDRNDAVENVTDRTLADALLASDMMQQTLRQLLVDGKVVNDHVERKIEYDFITSVSTDLSIALYDGYLNAVPDRSVPSTFRLSLANEQARTSAEDKIVEWTCRRLKTKSHFFWSLSEQLINGEISEFENTLRILLAALPPANRTAVDRDLYYDGLIKSLAFALRDLYSVRVDDRWRDRRSGKSDMVLTSRQGSFEKQMIIIGYETVRDEEDNGRLDEMVLTQLQRLDGAAKNITSTYYEYNVTDMLKFAVVFRGKDFRLGYRL